MNHAHFGDLPRSVWPVRCHDEIHSGVAQPDQFTQGLHASSGAGSAHGPKPEPLDDARNDFAVLVLADEDMRARAAIGQGHHELTGMPEGDNDTFAFMVQPVYMLLASCFDPHRAAQRSDHRHTGWREQREFQPAFQRF